MARLDSIAAEHVLMTERPDFDRLVADHHAQVGRLVSRLLGWSPDVQDVVQDVFLAALNALPRFEGRSRVDTWLTRITINACRAHRRKQLLRLRRRAAMPDDPPGRDDSGGDPETIARVRAAIRALPARDREVVVLRYLEQMPIADIATVLGASRNAVEVRLHRARDRLRRPLADLVTDEP